MSSLEAVPVIAPRVSVLVITYQHAGYIEQCLDGILMQRTDFPVEVLVGEDESTDGTRAICQRYAAEHPDRIRLFLRERRDVIYINGKPTGRANFLKLLDDAKGEFIAVCEGDDHWTDPLKLQKQVNAMRANPHWSGCFHQVKLSIGSGSGAEGRIFPVKPEISEFTTNELLRPWFIPTCSLLFRNADPIQLPAWTRSTQSLDIPLILLLSLKGPIGYLDGVMGVYRIHGLGVSQSSEHRGYDKVKAMAYIYELFNVHTNYRFKDRVSEAFVEEVKAHLPEVKELIRLKASAGRNPSLMERVYYYLWVRVPFMRDGLDRMFGKRRRSVEARSTSGQ